jgi:hypothetical protein
MLKDVLSIPLAHARGSVALPSRDRKGAVTNRRDVLKGAVAAVLAACAPRLLKAQQPVNKLTGTLAVIDGGGANGKLKQGGQHLILPARTPIANLHLTLLQKVGHEQDHFGDSTGTIAGV